ncbi:hypothetical protein ACE7GA_11005 [Roseomonas sp. CCTCC AB2023176]|uniref:hypothetical protein n=1 Tax=Roseomonas sp. CCTCC AB2023176 TaxID=3342640 RepID=UPI0035E2DC60
MNGKRIGRRAGLLACVGLAAGRTAAARGTTPLRGLYDAAGEAPSVLARGLDGRRVALRGYPMPVPSHAPGWFVLAETSVAPCQLCGLTHDWPVGVVAVHAPDAPHIASPYVTVEVEGRLTLAPDPVPDLPGRLVLRDATVAVG